LHKKEGDQVLIDKTNTLKGTQLSAGKKRNIQEEVA
jgi:hypothetical protein